MEQYRFHKASIPKTIAERISDTVEFFPRDFNMPKLYSKNATINSTEDLIHELKNLAPVSPLVTLVNLHKEAMISLAEIFGKETSQELPLRVLIEGACPDKLQQVNQE